MSAHSAVHLAVAHGGGAAGGPPGGLSGAQYAVLGGCVVLLGLLALLLGLLTGPARSGMAGPAAARRLIGESGLRGAAGQLRPSRLEPRGRRQQQAVPGPRGRGRAPQESAPQGPARQGPAPGGSAPARAGGKRS